MPRSIFHCWFVALLSLCGLCFAATQDGEIPPPFGLRWGESAQKIETLLKGSKATIVDKRQTDTLEVWTVEGIVQTGLRHALFSLHQGQLARVELQYQSDEWDTAKYDAFMASIRQRLDTKHGPGELIARSKTSQEKALQTIVGYKWSKPHSSIQLVYFSAENASQIFRTISIHYNAL